MRGREGREIQEGGKGGNEREAEETQLELEKIRSIVSKQEVERGEGKGGKERKVEREGKE